MSCSDSTIFFLGAGKCNVVVALPTTYFSHLPSLPSLPPSTALRIRSAVYQECHVCYAALQDFAGWRHVIPLPAALLEKIYTAVPAKYHPLMQHSTEAVLMPNFTTDPRPSISVGVADYTVEIKPKAAWRRPEAVGIIADGVTYYIQSSKYYHCRYAHMQPFKQLRDGATGTAASVLSPYCPNYLYRADLSSREGLRRLAVSPQNNLKVLCHHPSHRVRIEAGLQRLLVEEDELDIIADALDASLVLPILQHLQLYGTAPQQRGCTSQGEAARSDVAEAVDSMVLDIELLNRWASAQDPQSVKWLVLPPLNEDAERNGDVHCQCCGGERAVGLPVTPPCFQDASPVSPPMDLKTSIERFYASTTARDVSLLVAVSLHDTNAQNGAAPPMDKNATSTEGVVIQVGNRLCRVAVVDLDDKQHKSLQHYAKHDASIVDAWKNHCH